MIMVKQGLALAMQHLTTSMSGLETPIRIPPEDLCRTVTVSPNV